MKWQLRIIQALSVAGIVVAFYLHLFHEGLVFPTCSSTQNWMQTIGIELDCYNVSGGNAPYSSLSAFAVLRDIPFVNQLSVAQAGLIGYVTIFSTIWLGDLWKRWAKFGQASTILIVIGAFLFTAWLTWIEATELGAFCTYCLYSAGIITLMFLLAVHLLYDSA